jgi:hypothetical protein
MHHVLITKFAVFFKLNFVRRLPLVLSRCIIPPLAVCTRKRYKYSIHC